MKQRIPYVPKHRRTTSYDVKMRYKRYISLQKSIIALENGIEIYNKKKLIGENEEEIEIIKSGVIQNFEICYEISWKLMKKWLEENIGVSAVDGISRKELFRIASQNKLIENIEKWFEFHEARNSTSHDYDGIKAEEVFKQALEFPTYVRKLQERLENIK